MLPALARAKARLLRAGERLPVEQAQALVDRALVALESSAYKLGAMVGAEDALALYSVLRDPDAPLYARSVAATALLLVLSPLDAIPDAIPVFGQLDDISALKLARKLVDPYVAGVNASRAYATENVDLMADLRAWEQARTGPAEITDGLQAIAAKVEPFTYSVDQSPRGMSGVRARKHHAGAFARALTLATRQMGALGFYLGGKLGCGSYGCAFRGKPYAVKVTGDTREAANAQAILDAQREANPEEPHTPLPGLVAFYAVYGLEDAPAYFVIVQEVLEPLNAPEVRWIDRHRMDAGFRQATLGLTSKEDFYYSVNHAFEELGFPREDANGSARPVRGVERELRNTDASGLYRALLRMYRMGISFEDGHSDNTMVRVNADGVRYLVYLDLGYSTSPGVTIPMLSEDAPVIRAYADLLNHRPQRTKRLRAPAVPRAPIDEP